MSRLITAAEQVTPEWLTDVLRREGVIARGAVTAVDTTRLPHLVLSYSCDVPTSAPATLFLKFGRQGHPTSNLGPKEVAAYRAFAQHRANLPMLLECYDSAADEVSETSHLLLADFSATHARPAYPIPLPKERDAILDCTARFHAYWWQHPQRDLFSVYDASTSLDCTSAAAYAAYVTRSQEAYPYFAGYLGEKLPTDERALFEQLLATLPALWPRYLASRFAAWDAITLGQGDSHWFQFAIPHQAADQRTLLLDLECLHWGVPAADLAYRLSTGWTPEQRRALEPQLIANYLAALRHYGIAGYDQERFWQDYRLSTIFVLLMFVKEFVASNPRRAAHGQMAKILGPGWGGALEYVLANYRDMRCVELLI